MRSATTPQVSGFAQDNKNKNLQPGDTMSL